MPFVLENWQSILKGVLAALLAIFLLYSCHLYYKVDALAAENTALTGQVTYLGSYVEKTQTLQAENDAVKDKLTKALADSHDNKACPISKSVRDVISQLQ